MLRLYIDTNLFSKIKDGSLPKLHQKLKVAAENQFLCFYSQAHINDLHQDKTENKFIRMDIMSELVHDNFLHYNLDHDNIKNSLVYPRDAYENFKPDESTFEDWATKIFDDPEDELGIGKILKNAFQNQEIDLKLFDHPSNNTDEAKEMLARIGINKSKYNMLEWIKVVGKMMDVFQNDDGVIKEARRLSKIHLNVDKFNLKIDEINFNENLADSVLGKSFLDLLEDQLKNYQSNGESISIFNRITTAFNMVNFLGFDNEKNKKVKFLNTQHDGQHCYYGSICDIVVSDDKGFIQKSKFIYNLYGIDTQVLDIDEFINYLKFSRIENHADYDSFSNSLNYDIDNGIVVGTNTSIEMQQVDEIVKPVSRYFDYMNRISRIRLYDSDEKYLILYRQTFRTQRYSFYKEVSQITNNCCEIFGSDDYGLKEFTDKDLDELRKK